MPTPPTTAPLRLTFSLLGDALRMARRVPSARERRRLAALTGRSLLRLASRRPGLTGKLVPTLRPRAYELRPEAGMAPLRLHSDDFVCMEVFGGRPYALDYSAIEPVRTIVDLGANIGAAAAFLAHLFPGAVVVAVEPSPSSYETLRENLDRAVPGSRAVNAALVPRAGSYRIEPGRSPSGDRVVDAATGDGEVQVQGAAGFEALTIDQLLDREAPDGVDLLKVDIEGAEAEFFAGVAGWGDRVGAVVAEVHPPLSVERAYELLAAGGFEPLPRPPGRAHGQIVFAARPRGV